MAPGAPPGAPPGASRGHFGGTKQILNDLGTHKQLMTHREPQAPGLRIGHGGGKAEGKWILSTGQFPNSQKYNQKTIPFLQLARGNVWPTEALRPITNAYA